MNSFAFLEKSARQQGDGLALIHGDERISYRDFHKRAMVWRVCATSACNAPAG